MSDQREIKFRLIKDGKVVGYETLVRIECGWLGWNYCDSMELKAGVTLPSIAHDHKDEFTGLLDKNGKEICEGDIVRSVGIGVRPGIGTVEYRGMAFCFVGKFTDPPNEVMGNKWYDTITVHRTHDHNVEVIGNIHENSDLLKESSDE